MPANPKKGGRGLSQQTKQMLSLIADGKTPQEIALITGAPNATVRDTLRRLRKFGHNIPIFSQSPLSAGAVSVLVPMATFGAIKAAGERFDMRGEEAIRALLKAIVETPALLSNLLDPEA